MKARIFRAAIIALFTALFTVNIYRAATQSITVDEAYAYDLFIEPPLAQVLTSFNATHHVLQSLLSKRSVKSFGVSEFTLRLPTLIGGLLYFVVVYRLSRSAFGSGWLFLLSGALLALNPFILDHLSAARGYGLALACMLWALYFLWSNQPFKGAVALALTVASNLAFLFPAMALALLFTVATLIDHRKSFERGFSTVVDDFIVPGVVIAFLILVLPLSRAEKWNFYFGVPALSNTLQSLIDLSFFHHPTAVQLPLRSYDPHIAAWIVSAVLVLAAVACFIVHDRFLWFSAGTMLLTIGLLVFSHYFFHALYPVSRTALYFIPFFVLTCFTLLKQLEVRSRLYSVAAPIFLLAAGVCLVQFGMQFNISDYAEWRFDAGTKRIANLLRSRQHSNRNVRVGSSWPVSVSLEFYRKMYHLKWMDPVSRISPDTGYDYYVLMTSDSALIDKRHLKVLYRDEVSGTVLAGN
jgi:hypothetical protein